MLIFSISFSALHASMIDTFDKDHCSVSKFDQKSELIFDGDICKSHCLFHSPMFLTLSTPFSFKISRSSKIQLSLKTYSFNHVDTFLKPPIL
jgi:hypothetical protein